MLPPNLLDNVLPSLHSSHLFTPPPIPSLYEVFNFIFDGAQRSYEGELFGSTLLWLNDASLITPHNKLITDMMRLIFDNSDKRTSAIIELNRLQKSIAYRSPANLNIMRTRALLYQHSGDRLNEWSDQQNFKELTRVLSLNAQEAHGLLWEGYTHHQAGNMDEALSFYSQHIAQILGPDYQDRVVAYLRKFPEDLGVVEVLLSRASIHHAAGRLDQALTDFNACLQVVQSDILAARLNSRGNDVNQLKLIIFHNLQTIYAAKKPLESALLYCREILELDPSRKDLHKHLALQLYSEKKYEKALIHFNAFLPNTNDSEVKEEDEPPSSSNAIAESYLCRAIIYDKQDDIDASISDLYSCLNYLEQANDPHSEKNADFIKIYSYALFLLAALHQGKNLYEFSTDNLTDCMEIMDSPHAQVPISKAELLAQRAEMYFLLNHLEEAAEDCLKYLSSFPKEQEILSLLEKIVAKKNPATLSEKDIWQKRGHSFLESLRKANDPNIKMDALLSEIYDLTLVDKFDDALKLTSAHLSQNPDDLVILEKQGLLFAQAKQFDKAIETFSALTKQGVVTSNLYRAMVYIEKGLYIESLQDCASVLQSSVETLYPRIREIQAACNEKLQEKQNNRGSLKAKMSALRSQRTKR